MYNIYIYIYNLYNWPRDCNLYPILPYFVCILGEFIHPISIEDGAENGTLLLSGLV